MIDQPAITETRFAFLLSGDNATTTHGKASLTVNGDRFVMSGPSGVHSLLVAATDRERLDAHWKGFCQTAINRA